MLPLVQFCSRIWPPSRSLQSISRMNSVRSRRQDATVGFWLYLPQNISRGTVRKVPRNAIPLPAAFADNHHKTSRRSCRIRQRVSTVRHRGISSCTSFRHSVLGQFRRRWRKAGQRLLERLYLAPQRRCLCPLNLKLSIESLLCPLRFDKLFLKPGV